MKNRIFMMLIFVLSIFVLTACGPKDVESFKLTLPTEIIANVTDLENISENTVVTLTVDVPSNKEIDELKINNEVVVVSSNNTYVFTIKEDVVVTVTFKDIVIVYYKLTLPEGVTANKTDLENIESGSEVVLTITVPTNKVVDTFKVNNEDKTIVNNKFTFNITKNTVVTISFKDKETTVSYFNLTLPTEVSSNITNLNEVEENTEVVLTVTIPTNKEVDSFKVNNEEKELTNNKFTFNITKDTTVTVSFKDIEVTNYFKLALPTLVSSNVTNLNEIEENTEVTLTVNSEVSLQVDKLLVNDEEVTLVNDKYTFTITKNTVVELVLLSSWEEVDEALVEALVNGLDVSLFKEGIFKTTKLLNDGEFFVDEESLYELDEDFNLTKGYVVRKHFYEEILSVIEIEYLDGTYQYNIQDQYNIAGDLSNTHTYAAAIDTSMQGLEIFGAFFGENPILPKSFNSIDELATALFTASKGGLINNEMFESVKFYTKDNLIKIEIEDDNLDFFGSFYKDSLTKDNLTIIFEDNKVKEFRIEIGEEVLIEFMYGDFEFEIDPRALQVDTAEATFLTYNYHLSEDEVVQVHLDERLVVQLVHISLFEIYNLLKPYKPGKRVVALYLDDEFTTLLEPEDYLTDELDIYVKWEDIIPVEDIIASLIIDDAIFLKTLDDSEYYFEDEEVIFYIRNNYNLTIVDKVNMKHYEVILMGSVEFISYEMDLITDKPFLLDKLNSYKNEDFITLKGLQINMDDDFMFIGEWLNVEYDRFVALEDNIYIKHDDVFDKSQIDKYIQQAVPAEVSYVYPVADEDYIDINNIEQEIILIVIYTNGHSIEILLGEGEDLGITYEVIESVLHIHYNNNSQVYNDFLFYDSSQGEAIIIDGFFVYYLDQLTELPKTNFGKYRRLIYYQTENGVKIDTFSELQDYEFTGPYLNLYSVSEKLDGLEVVDKLNEFDNISFFSWYYDVNYNLSERTYQISNFDEQLIFKIDEDYYYFTSLEAYIQIPIEHFDLENLVSFNWYTNFPMFYTYIKHLLTGLILLDEALNTEVTFDLTHLGYIYSNGLELTIEDVGIYIEMNGYYFLIHEEEHAQSFVLLDEQAYSFTFYNNVTLPIVYKADVGVNVTFFTYNFDGYAINEYYLADSNKEPNFDEKFIKDGWLEFNEYEVFAYYDVRLNPTEYLTELLENDQFMLIGQSITMKINKNTYGEIYYNNELTYVIDFINNKSYYLEDDILYEFNFSDTIFNIVEFINVVEDENFVFNGINEYYVSGRVEDFDVLFYIYTANNNLKIEDMLLEVNTYEIEVVDFKSVDLSLYEMEKEEIEEIIVYSYELYVLSVNNLNMLDITLVFNTPMMISYSYSNFIETYDGRYEDGIIYYYFHEEERQIDLSSYGITIFDESIEQVVVFYGLNTYSYISDLTELPKMGDSTYLIFDHWEKDFYYPIYEVSDLAEFNDEIIYLNGIYRDPTMEELLPFLEAKEFVEIQLNYRNYANTNRSTSLNFTYSYLDDWFVLVRNNKPVIVGFIDDDIFISTTTQYVRYNKEVYTLKGLADFLEIDNFNQVISDLDMYRSFLLDEFVGYKVEDFIYYNDGFLKVRLESNMHRISIIRSDISDFHYIRVKDPTYGEVAPKLFEMTLIIFSSFTNDEIVVSGKNKFHQLNMKFEIEGYDFEDYYLYDEFGNVDFDVIFDYNTHDDYTQLLLYAMYRND